MEERINSDFPQDRYTISIIKEVEEYLEIPHRNITLMKKCEVHE